MLFARDLRRLPRGPCRHGRMLVFAASALAFIPPPIHRPADPTYIQTHNWTFSDPSSYLFDPSRIEFASGHARLVETVPWFDAHWRYRRTIVIDNSLGWEDLHNFQLPLVLRAPGFDFAHARADGADLRFTGSDGQTVLPHWLESFDSAAGLAHVSVNVPSIPAGETESIELFYGNADAVSTSDWTSTFKQGPPPPVTSTVSSNAGHDAFPGLVELPSGELLATFRRGSEHLSLDGKIMLARSTDGGTSWSIADLFDEPGIDDRADLGLARLGDGNLILPFYQISTLSSGPGANAPAPPFAGSVNPTIDGSFIILSSDGGATWSPKIAVSDTTRFLWTAAYGQVLELDDGTIVLPAYALALGAQRTSSILMQSQDGGLSWSLRSTVASNALLDYNETSIRRLGSHSLLAAVRCESVPPAISLVRSDDDGLSWGVPVPLSDGVSPDLTVLSDGRLLLSSGDRNPPGTGIRAAMSSDGGANWSRPVMLAKSQGDLGYPAAVELDSGALLTVWYDPEGVHASRYAPEFVGANPNYDNMLDDIEQGIGGWLAVQGSGVRCSNDAAHSGMTSLLVHDTDQTPVRATRQIYDCPRSEGTIAFWVYPHELPNGAVFSLLDDLVPANDPLQDARLQLCIFPDGSLRYRTPLCSGWIATSATVPLGGWTRISIQLQSSAVVSVNGVPCASVRLCNSEPGITCLCISAASEPGIGDAFFVDDISTSQAAPFDLPAVIGPETAHYPGNDPTIAALSSGLREPETLLSFAETRTGSGGATRYQLSNDGGATWRWWNGSAWVAAAAVFSEANPATETGAHIGSFPASGPIVFRAFLHSDGSERVELNRVSVTYATSRPPLMTQPAGPARIEALAGTIDLFVAPNPARKSAALGFAAPPGRYALEIYDATGRLRWSRAVEAGGLEDRAAPVRIEWSGTLPPLPGGTYWLRARDERGGVRAVRRFVVLR